MHPKEIIRKENGEKKRGFLHKDSRQNIIYNGPLLPRQRERAEPGKLWNFYSMESLQALKRIIIIREAAERHGEKGANIITSNEKKKNQGSQFLVQLCKHLQCALLVRKKRQAK